MTDKTQLEVVFDLKMEIERLNLRHQQNLEKLADQRGDIARLESEVAWLKSRFPANPVVEDIAQAESGEERQFSVEPDSHFPLGWVIAVVFVMLFSGVVLAYRFH